jgi:hypothetical protein
VAVCDQAIAAIAKCVRKKEPRQQSRKNQHCVGNIIRRKSGYATEYHSQNHHEKQRPEDNPADSDYGLLVSNQDIPPSQEKQKLAVTPDITPVRLLRQSILNYIDYFVWTIRGFSEISERPI